MLEWQGIYTFVMPLRDVFMHFLKCQKWPIHLEIPKYTLNDNVNAMENPCFSHC